MKRRILQFIAMLFLSITGVHAQTTCTDLNGYVSYKNSGNTGYYTLDAGYEEKAAQTYHYSGPGKVSAVRVYGNYPGIIGGVPLRVGIYNVDNTGRPTTLIQATNITWWWFDNITGYITVNFGGGGVFIDQDFAVEVELRTASPWGNTFRLQYTGNGEGHGENLAALAGTSTGGNWSSAMTDFSRDGDFYLVPRMTHYITSDFSINSPCISAGSTVNFSNSSDFSKDSMFNKIAMLNSAGNYYDWDFGDGSAVSHAINPSHVYTTPGVYTVTLTSNLEGWYGNCSNVKTMQISVGLAATTSSIVNVSCHGGADGAFMGGATGGAAPYTYSINDETYYSNPLFMELGAGTYTLQVTDHIGCTTSTSVTITEPQPINFTSVQSTNSSCGNADGGISVTATGGTGALLYKLNSGSYQNNGSFSNKASGTYTVTVKDARDCTVSLLVSISDAGGPTLSIVSMTNASCNAASDGSIVLNGTGGAGVLQYSINGGVTYQTSGSFLNIPAGEYAAIVKDANGCSKSTIINITQPQRLSVAASSVPVQCFGGHTGQVVVTAAGGGTGSFTYSINGSGYQSGLTFPGLAAGNYVVRVKDVAGCTSTDTVVVLQPSALSATAATEATTCYDGYNGTITISATGGTGEYSYSFADGEPQNSPSFSELSAGSYTIEVMDENNCKFNVTATVTEPTQVTAAINVTASTCGNSNGGLLAIATGGTGSGYLYSITSSTYNTTGLFNGLSAGTYYVIIADAAGCANIFTANITDANGPVIGTSAHTNVACNGGSDGSITVSNITGGTGVLEYSINGTNWQTSPVFTGLSAGHFSITVKDANGCTGTITETITEPSGFVITTSLQDLTCNGNHSGAATVFASGGSGVFAYTISGSSYQSSNTFTGLAAGTYMAVVRDAAGCYGYNLFELTEPTVITVLHGELNVSCNGAEDGTIALLSSGGTGAFTYSLDGDSYQSSNYFSGLSGGQYTGYVKDANGCVKTVSIPLLEPQLLTISATTSDVSCAGGSNGIITLDVNGGTAPYTYNWSEETDGPNLFNLEAGTYTVRVEDNNGCHTTSTYTITQPSSPLIVNGVVVDASSSTSSDGTVTITVTGGVNPYTYSWSNGATTRDLAEVAAGSYSVNVTDANGCITTGIFMVGSATGISKVTQDGVSIALYPNPATDVTTIEVNKYTISNLKMINMNGELVLETEPNTNKTVISTNEIPSGVYFIKLIINGNQLVKKLTVSK